MRTVSVILVNYKSSNDIINLLRRFLAYHDDDVTFNFIVTDNSGEFKCPPDISILNVTVINKNDNLGYCGGNNIAYDFIQKAFPNSDVIVCNPDVEFEPSQVSQLVLMDKPEGIYTLPAIDDSSKPLYTNIRLKGFFQKITREQNVQSVTPTDYCPGSFLYFNLQKVKVDKLFDTNFFMYWEEVELAIRLTKKGAGCYFVNNLGHIVRKSNDENRLFNSIYYYLRNANYLHKLHSDYFTFYDLIKFWGVSLAVFLIKSIRALNLRIFTSALLGIYDGVRGITGKK